MALLIAERSVNGIATHKAWEHDSTLASRGQEARWKGVFPGQQDAAAVVA